MKNYNIIHLNDINKLKRIELHDQLNLTSSEISINQINAGESLPFVHSHKQNEEIYFILNGEGLLYIDGEEIIIKKDDVFRISPQGARSIKADDNSSLSYICIQAKANSLENFTLKDGKLEDCKPSWLQQ
ncbi:MAG: cupin domain-containing protein [Alphaproteobacteria bacterium]